MLLPFDDRLSQTNKFDPEGCELADRHYPNRTRREKTRSNQFVGPGEQIVLRNNEGTVLFVWIRNTIERLDKQVGINCSIFRNESSRLSSDIILEAEQFAVRKWGPTRAFTYVDESKIRSSNPGYCFQKSGWKKCGRSKTYGKVILEKYLTV